MSLLGRLALRWYYTPVSRLRDCVREGGPFEQRRTECGRRDMEQAARDLPSLPSATGNPVALQVLTGRRFWYQTLFCLWTFAQHSGRTVHPVVYDDGTLSPDLRAPLTRHFPAIRFVEQAETIQRLDAFLPVARYPVLRERWRNYPNLRKLIDVHAGRAEWRLVVDSDLLFFREPRFLLEWLDQPQTPLHAVDCETSYGYSRPLMNELAGAPVAELVNVGLTGLNGAALDWEKLEHWCATLLAREGTSYYLEQALIAMLLAGRSCTVAPGRDYVTLPVSPEAQACRAVMHHYVAHAKRDYFQRNWRHALRLADPTGPARAPR